MVAMPTNLCMYEFTHNDPIPLPRKYIKQTMYQPDHYKWKHVFVNYSAEHHKYAAEWEDVRYTVSVLAYEYMYLSL